MKFSTRSKYKLTMAATLVVAGAFSQKDFGASNLVTYTGGTFSPTWSGLPSNTGTAVIATLPSGSGTTSNPADLSTAFGAVSSSYASEPALNGWYFASASTTQKIAVGTPSTTTGALFLSGTSPDQSLGVISTSSTGLEYFGVELQNETGGNLNSLNVSFNDLIIWPNAAKPLDFGYSVDNSTASSDVMPTSGLNNVSSLASAFSSSATTSTAPETRSGTIALTTPLQNNGAIWLVWSTSTATGTSQGVAMNGLSASLSEVAAPSVTWNTSFGTWDDTHANWTGAPTYNDPDTVTFANSLTTNSVVTVQSGGVSPGSVTINNTTAFRYLFAGGSINGSGSLTNTAGTAELSVANGYGGGTVINGGTLIADGDATLGSATGGVSFGGGTFQAGAAIGSTGTPSQRSLTVNTGGGTFNTNGFNSVFSGAASIGDVLNVTTGTAGVGGLEMDGAVSFSSTGALNIGSGATVTLGGSGTISQINNSNYDGKLLVTGTARLNVDANATISSGMGTGEIDIANGGTVSSQTTTGMTPVTYTTYNTGVAITNASGDPGGTINIPIKLNSSYSGSGFLAADVTQPDASFVPGNFTVTIGGTTGGMIDIGSVISGYSDVNFANSPAGGGKGMTILGAANTYKGTTLINTNGTLQLAVPDALPTSTDVIFGTISGAEGKTTAIDLDGNTEQINSLSSGQFNHPTDENITNFGSTNTATLVVSGSTTPANSFVGVIGDGIGPVALVKGGSNTLILAGADAYSGGTTVSGGTLQAGNNSAFGTGTVEVDSPGLIDLNAFSPAIGNLSGSGIVDNVFAVGTPTLSISTSISSNFSGVIRNTTGSTALNVNGTGTQTLSGPNTYTGGTTVSGGTLVIAPTTTANVVALPANTAVAIGAAGTVQLADNASASTPFVSSAADISNQLMTMSSLSIAAGGVLDVRNNHFYVADSGGPDDATYQSILGYVSNGANSISNGVITSTEGLPGYGIGIVDGNDGILGTPVSAGQIEVAYTLQGDANLDGKVDITDFNIFAPSFGLPTTLGWEAGDFDYSGTVDIGDFNLFAGNFGLSDNGTAVSMPAADVAALDAFAAANGLTLTSVPEPASLSLLIMGVVGVMARRRRRQ